jgi:glutathione synthase/RimK-type ligase-like ATP-grasp enzyme
MPTGLTLLLTLVKSRRPAYLVVSACGCEPQADTLRNEEIMTEIIASNKTVLIASSSIDQDVWRPVANILAGRGYDVLAYEADKVADGSVTFTVQVDNDRDAIITYGSRRLRPEGINAAWYRRPTMFAEEQADKARSVSLDLERNAIQHAIWSSIHEEVWLSSPRRIQHAERKLTQLLLAKELGFVVPDTVITNTWGTINDSLPERIIFKPSYGMFYDKEGLKILYVHPLRNKPDQLPTGGVPYPGFWQPFLGKAREWRITVVGDNSFDAAIYTDEVAKDDWRRHQLTTDHVVFKAEHFPDGQKERCFEYLARLGIKFGAFDFIEDSDGNITFLECNANGQYGWLEDELGFPISEAIAGELASIARTS